MFGGYVAAFLDWVNVGFAKLQMAGDVQFSDAVYGFGEDIWSRPTALLGGIAAGIAWINSVGYLGGHNSAPTFSAV